jgi:hypothetical protein
VGGEGAVEAEAFAEVDRVDIEGGVRRSEEALDQRFAGVGWCYKGGHWLGLLL